MDILYLLIPLSLVLVFLIGVVSWPLGNGQFDDLEGRLIAFWRTTRLRRRVESTATVARAATWRAQNS